MKKRVGDYVLTTGKDLKRKDALYVEWESGAIIHIKGVTAVAWVVVVIAFSFFLGAALS